MRRNRVKRPAILLGERVQYTAILDRVYTEAPALWREGAYTWEALALHHPAVGVLVGYRKLNEGHTTYNHEDGREWHTTGTKHAALVAFDLYVNPVYVPLDAITLHRGAYVAQVP